MYGNEYNKLSLSTSIDELSQLSKPEMDTLLAHKLEYFKNTIPRDISSIHKWSINIFRNNSVLLHHASYDIQPLVGGNSDKIKYLKYKNKY
jgi:hypothetical protein